MVVVVASRGRRLLVWQGPTSRSRQSAIRPSVSIFRLKSDGVAVLLNPECNFVMLEAKVEEQSCWRENLRSSCRIIEAAGRMSTSLSWADLKLMKRSGVMLKYQRAGFQDSGSTVVVCYGNCRCTMYTVLSTIVTIHSTQSQYRAGQDHGR